MRSFPIRIRDERGCAAAARGKMAARKPQTFAKLQRERRVKEKRQLKLEKKQARKLEAANGDASIVEAAEGEPSMVSPPTDD